MKSKTFIFLISYAVLVSSTVSANDGFAGKYENLNGEMFHEFFPTGDYHLRYLYGINNEKSETIKGVYRQESGVCWSKNKDGSKNVLGNLILYYNDDQCCLSLHNISDKIVADVVWSSSYPYSSLCKNQVLQKIE